MAKVEWSGASESVGSLAVCVALNGDGTDRTETVSRALAGAINIPEASPMYVWRHANNQTPQQLNHTCMAANASVR